MPGIKQVNLSVNARNTAALRLYESTGFNVCGCERGAMILAGEPQDEVLMCLRLADG